MKLLLTLVAITICCFGDIQAITPYQNPILSSSCEYIDLNHTINPVSKILLYPNPVAQEDIFVRLKTAKKGVIRVDILANNGTLYQSIKHNAVGHLEVIKIQVDQLPKGIYSLAIYSGPKTYTKKFIKA